jgi:hypothetical protein
MTLDVALTLVIIPAASALFATENFRVDLVCISRQTRVPDSSSGGRWSQWNWRATDLAPPLAIEFSKQDGRTLGEFSPWSGRFLR